MASEYVLGIDLGTTYSCVAVVEAGNARVLEQKGGYRTLPSVVAFNPDGSSMIGHIAKRQAVTNAENTIYAAKRLIGRVFEAPEVARASQLVPYKIVQGPNRDPRVRVFGKNHPIQEISALILRQIKAIAEEALHCRLDKAVITVPAYFSDGQRQATRDAGEIAGLDVLRIINEPTAASLAFGYNKRLNKKIAVYDLGGGTFDISVLDISTDTFEVLSTAGNTFLGGEDFDIRILEFIIKSFQTEHGFDLKEDKMALQRLKDASEAAKCQLSGSLETEINLPFITTIAGESKHLKYSLHRAELEKLTEDLVDQSIKICQSALDMAALKISDIDDVLLVGGMTRMPLVQQRVQEFFGRIPAKNVHPDEAVAVGAALMGASLVEEEAAILLLDVTPLSLGVRTAGGYTSIIVPKNSTIPTSANHVFTTVTDNQQSVKIQVVQGEAKLASENQPLGEFTLTDIPEAAAGVPQIEVTFSIDSNGILEVSAKDLHSQREQSIVVSAASYLSDEEMHSLSSQNESQALQDDLLTGLKPVK
ncbi:MAG: molecular chaperone DnaK [Deltaproteobacteria bacterium CG11_big_fil_rev_8_21_14_0_20_45_16]|nr:MAG: molecular chaperone DnaK [Deltaproteobacteria bacterium CG11_big_fil_rev_8_21_14_0_20_45_16]